MAELPRILALPVSAEEARNSGNAAHPFNFDEARWYADGEKLVGQPIDKVIEMFGDGYLITLYLGRKQPRMYYRFAGTHSWGIYGVVVLDKDLRVVRITMDPECRTRILKSK